MSQNVIATKEIFFVPTNQNNISTKMEVDFSKLYYQKLELNITMKF